MRVRCERAVRFVVLVVFALAVARAQPAGQAASGTASASLPVSVTFAPRLSLHRVHSRADVSRDRLLAG